MGHSLVSHKEIRFLFPLAPILPFFLLWAFEAGPIFLKKIWTTLWLRYFLIYLNLALYLVFCFSPANYYANYYEKLHIHLIKNNTFYFTTHEAVVAEGLKLNFYVPAQMVMQKISNCNELRFKISGSFLCQDYGEMLGSLPSECRVIARITPEWMPLIAKKLFKLPTTNETTYQCNKN